MSSGEAVVPGELVGCDVLFELLPQPAALVAANGGVMYLSPAMRRLYPDPQAFRAALLPVAASGGLLEAAGRSWRPRRYSGADGAAPSLWILDDVTEEVGAVKSRDEYLSMIVHDLRGPLSGIRGTLDFALEDPDLALGELHRDLFREAREESNRMMNLVNTILDFTKIRAGRYHADVEPVNPRILLRRAMVAVRTLATRQAITIETQVARNLPAIAGSTDKLLQALNNLLVNAFKFTRSGGVILVTAEERQGEAGDRRVAVVIADTGPGIALEKQDELFAKFSEVGTKTDKDIAGTGLGLFITKAILEAYGGRIFFASIPGVGTSFLLDLPVYEQERVDASGPIPLEKISPGST